MNRGEIGLEQHPVSLQNRDCPRPLGRRLAIKFTAAVAAVSRDTHRHHPPLVLVRMGGSWCYSWSEYTTITLLRIGYLSWCALMTTEPSSLSDVPFILTI